MKMVNEFREWQSDQSKLHLIYKWADGSELSTIELPPLYVYNGNKVWESCIFYANGYSEVVRRWASEDAARQGHEKMIVEYSQHG